MVLETDSILNQISLAAYSPQLYLCWGKDTLSSRGVGCAPGTSPRKSESFVSATIAAGESNTLQAGQAGTARGSDHSHEQQTRTTGWMQ